MTRSSIRQRRPRPHESFLCVHCGYPVMAAAPGTRHRNHCPHCLYSQHLDLRPGDRLCSCRSPMRPIALWVRTDGELALIHRCERCGTLRSNRIAGDDNPVALRALLQRAWDQTHLAQGHGECHDQL